MTKTPRSFTVTVNEMNQTAKSVMDKLYNILEMISLYEFRIKSNRGYLRSLILHKEMLQHDIEIYFMVIERLKQRFNKQLDLMIYEGI